MQSKQSKRQRIKLGREKLQRIIDICRSIEERSLDPFLLNVDEIVQVLREYFPEWKLPEDLCLDAETIHHLASVIKLQSEWVKNRSTSLYTDPFLLEEKLTSLNVEEIVQVFLKVWHPIVEMEQISIHSLAEAFRYWKSLLPLNERWKEERPIEVEVETATREDMVKQKILLDKAFSEQLENLWIELKKLTKEKGEEGKIRYWDFIGRKTYKETVQRAFMTSFLITYGYATLEIHPLKEEIYIKPFEKPLTKIHSEQLISIPVAVTKEEWMSWLKSKGENYE